MEVYKFKHISLLLIVIIGFLSSQIFGQKKIITKNWMELSDLHKQEIINNATLLQSAKNYYNNTFQVSDDSLTFKLLDSLSNPPKKFLVFYFELLLQISNESDGALSEVMGDYLYRISLNQPNYFLHELENLTKYGVEQNIKHKVFFFIGYEIGSQNKPYLAFGNYKTIFSYKLKMNNLVNQNLVNDFFNTVEKCINEIEGN